LAYKNLPKSISKLVLNGSKNIKAVLQKTGAEFYLFYKLNATELKFGSVLNGAFKADNWITIGRKLEAIENCVYLGKDGKIVTGTIEVLEKDGVVGVRVLEESLLKNGKFADNLLENDYEKYLVRKAKQGKSPPMARICNPDRADIKKIFRER
jgi:hypothetical protein